MRLVGRERLQPQVRRHRCRDHRADRRREPQTQPPRRYRSRDVALCSEWARRLLQPRRGRRTSRRRRKRPRRTSCSGAAYGLLRWPLGLLRWPLDPTASTSGRALEPATGRSAGAQCFRCEMLEARCFQPCMQRSTCSPAAAVPQKPHLSPAMGRPRPMLGTRRFQRHYGTLRCDVTLTLIPGKSHCLCRACPRIGHVACRIR